MSYAEMCFLLAMILLAPHGPRGAAVFFGLAFSLLGWLTYGGLI